MPIIPNERYVCSRKDYEFFGRQTREAHNREAYLDSVLPVVEAGHSPGSVVVNAQRGGSRAVFMSDMVHHPIQLVRPDIPFFADEDPKHACATRCVTSAMNFFEVKKC